MENPSQLALFLLVRPPSLSPILGLFFGSLASFLGVQVFHAGTNIGSGSATVTAGGRVIVVSAFAPSLQEALAAVYKGVDAVQFEGKTFRRDIAHR